MKLTRAQFRSLVESVIKETEDPELGSYEAAETVGAIDRAIEELGTAHGFLAYAEHDLAHKIAEALSSMKALRDEVHNELLGSDDEVEQPKSRDFKMPPEEPHLGHFYPHSREDDKYRFNR